MRVPFFVVVAAVFFSIAASWASYDDDEYADPNDVESWSNNLPEDSLEINNPAGICYTYKSEELAIFSKKSSDNSSKNQLYSCIKFNKDHRCASPLVKWAKLKGDDHDIRRIEIGNPSIYNLSLNYLIDLKAYSTPWSTFLVPGGDHLKVEFTRSHALSYLNQSVIKFVVLLYIYAAVKDILNCCRRTYVYIFEDQDDMCEDYRPNATEGLTGINAMTTAFYNRYKGKDYVTFAFFFIKQANNICMYRFKVNNMARHNASLEIDAFNFVSNYPTNNYAPHFFAFDQNLGAFVSLYWNGIRGNLPEAHFYVFHENEPERIDFTLSYPLQNFDPDVLEEIFKGDYGPEAYPAFVALGLQVFISFTPKGADHEFSGLWKNETEHFLFSRPLDNYQSLLRLRKDYIQITQAENPFNASFEHDPNSTNQVYIPQHTFTTIAIPYAADPDSDEHAANAEGSQHNQDGDGCSGDPLLWLLILFVILDVILIVVFIILIILSSLGAKKRKAKPHVMQKKSKRDPSKAVTPSTHGTLTTESKKMKKKGKPDKGMKTTEKTTTYYTVKPKKEETTTYYTVKDKKKAATIEEGTQFYTVDATFDHTVEKKK